MTQPIQLSFDVEQHPEVDFETPSCGSLRIAGEYGVKKDLNAGDRVAVTIRDSQGEVIAEGTAEVGPVGFKPITDSGSVIGMERQHKAKIE